MSSLTLEFEKVLFHSEHPIELMGKEDQIMEHNTRRVMKHSLILHGAMSLMHGMKVAREAEKIPRFNSPNILLSPRSMHLLSFIVSLLHKSQDEISFKEGGL
jgi:hypothetical protein